MKLGNLELKQVGALDFQLVAPSGVVLREGSIRQCTATWLQYDAAVEALMADVRKGHHEMCDSAHRLGERCISTVAPN